MAPAQSKVNDQNAACQNAAQIFTGWNRMASIESDPAVNDEAQRVRPRAGSLPTECYRLSRVTLAISCEAAQEGLKAANE